MIEEHDIVALTRPLPQHALEVGDVGTVVMMHHDHKGYTIEFSSFSGKTLALVTVEAKAVRRIRDREIANVRMVA